MTDTDYCGNNGILKSRFTGHDATNIDTKYASNATAVVFKSMSKKSSCFCAVIVMPRIHPLTKTGTARKN